MIDPNALQQHATPSQIRVAAAVEQYGSPKSAAKALGMPASSVRRTMSELRKRLREAGCAADTDAGSRSRIPTGQSYALAGYSISDKDEHGRRRNLRFKPVVDPDAQAKLLADAVANAVEGIKARPRIKAPRFRPSVKDLMNVMVVGDSHHGMLAWQPETLKSDYDLGISIDLERRAFLDLLARAPKAHKLTMIRVGDIFHADGDVWKTKRSGHNLDGDGRMPRVISDVVETSIWEVEVALKEYAEVELLIVPGNHDDLLAANLAIALRAAFRNNPRVKIGPTTGARFAFVQWGRVLLGTTHSDTTKGMKTLGDIMSHMCPEASNMLYRHWYCGHLHSRNEYKVDVIVKRENRFVSERGWSAEICETLAAADAYSAGCGYASRRTMKLDTYDKTTLLGTLFSRVFDEGDL